MENSGKFARRLRRTRRKVAEELIGAEQFRHRLVHRLPADLQLFDRLLRKSSRRRAQNPQQTLIVVRIDQNLQIRHRILDLAPFVKFLSAHQPVRHARAPKRHLQLARQMIRTVQYGKILVPEFRMFPLKLMNHPGDEIRFRLAIGRLHDPHRLAFPELRPELFRMAFPAGSGADHRVGRVENRGRRTIILFQFDHFRPGEMFRKVENVADVGSAPRINALIVISDYTEVARVAGKHFHNGELRGIRILIFIDEQIMVGSPITLQNIRKLGEQTVHQQKHVVEIERVLKFEQTLIFFINLRRGRFEFALRRAPRIPRFKQPALPAADHRVNFRQRKSFVIAPERPSGLLEQSLLVGIIGDGETRQIPEMRDLPPQHPDAERVKRPERHPAGDRGIDQLRETFAHFTGGLVGEGHSENRFRRNAGTEHIGDAKGDHPRLARPGSSQNQNRAAQRRNSFALFRVQLFQNRIFIHRTLREL